MSPGREGGSPLWATVVGQETAVERLRRAVESDRVAHAYAFLGPSGVGRRLVALGLAQAVLCPRRGCGACRVCRRVAAGQHPDCQVIAPQPPPENPRAQPVVRIEQIRQLIHAAALAPLEGPRKVFVLDDAERLTLPAAQALLKTLEEPPPRTLLVLVVAHARALPPTVLSRCQPVRFRPLPPAAAARVLETQGVAPEAAQLLARLCQGRVGLVAGRDPDALRAERTGALELLRLPPDRVLARLDEAAPDRATVAACLEVYRLWLRDLVCVAAGAPASLLVHADREPELRALARTAPPETWLAAMDAVREAGQAMDANVSPRLTLERVLLALGGRAA